MIWRTKRDGTRSVHGRVRLGRWQLGVHMYLHAYPSRSRRLVVQPFVVVDAK